MIDNLCKFCDQPLGDGIILHNDYFITHRNLGYNESAHLECYIYHCAHNCPRHYKSQPTMD